MLHSQAQVRACCGSSVGARMLRLLCLATALPDAELTAESGLDGSPFVRDAPVRDTDDHQHESRLAKHVQPDDLNHAAHGEVLRCGDCNVAANATESADCDDAARPVGRVVSKDLAGAQFVCEDHHGRPREL